MSTTDDTAAATPYSAEHELKTWPEFYAELVSGAKTFEVRKDDRGFKVGDVLHLREWRRLNMDGDGIYTGREMRRRVTYVLSGFGVERGFVVMGLDSAELLASLTREHERLTAEVDRLTAALQEAIGLLKESQTSIGGDWRHRRDLVIEARASQGEQ